MVHTCTSPGLAFGWGIIAARPICIKFAPMIFADMANNDWKTARL
jgi:hypothetical protein